MSLHLSLLRRPALFPPLFAFRLALFASSLCAARIRLQTCHRRPGPPMSSRRGTPRAQIQQLWNDAQYSQCAGPLPNLQGTPKTTTTTKSKNGDLAYAQKRGPPLRPTTERSTSLLPTQPGLFCSYCFILQNQMFYLITTTLYYKSTGPEYSCCKQSKSQERT